MKKIFHRLAKELRTRGSAGFVRFLGQKLVQRRGDHMYDIDLRQLTALPREGVVVVDRHSFGSEATRVVEEAVLTEANLEYRDELRGNEMLFAILNDNGHVASYGFVLFDSFYKRILGEDRVTPMISNCFTDPKDRGKGLYPQIIQAACINLASRGFKRAIITCSLKNAASIRGIEKAGFKRVKTLYTLVLLMRWIAWTKKVPAPARRPELS